MAPSMMTAPGFMAFTVCAEISFGAAAPGTSTVPISGSARPQRASTGSRLEQAVRRLWRCHRFIGDADHAGREEILGLLAVRREVEIGEEYLSGLEFLALGRERLFDLHDHFGPPINLVRIPRDLGAGSLVVAVGKTGTEAGVHLDQNAMTVGGQLVCRRGYQPHPVFVVLDFFGNADEHLILQV